MVSLRIIAIEFIANLAVPNIWLRPNNQRKEADAAKQLLTVPDGDHLTLLNVFNEYQNSASYFRLFPLLLISFSTCADLSDRNWAWNHYISARSLSQADNVRSQLLRIMERLEINLLTKAYDDQTRHYINIRQALVCGYFMQIAHKEGEKGSYLTVKDNQV